MPESILAITEREAVTAASLDHVLWARDRRAARQGTLLAEYGIPVLSLTLVSPGSVKDSPGRRILMDWAERSVFRILRNHGTDVRYHERQDALTGPESLWTIGLPAKSLKRLAMGIEDLEPWGRLIDVDVIIGNQGGLPAPLGRDEMGSPPRRCLVCAESASECIRARRHDPALMAAMVSSMIRDWTGHL